MAERWKQPAEKLSGDHPAWPLEAEYLALGILSIVCVTSPHRVIAGGGVMGHPHLIEAVRDRLRALIAGYLDTQMLGEHIDNYLVPPTLGDNAGVLALAQPCD
jgi:fructokinase